MLIGVGYGLADGYLLARPVIDTAGSTLEEVAVAAVWLAAITIVVVQVMRLPKVRARARKLLAGRPLRWLPELGSLLVVAVLAGFAIRPLVKFAQTKPGPVMSRYLAHLQHLLGLPVNPARPYNEEALYWAVWYVGLPGRAARRLRHRAAHPARAARVLTGRIRSERGGRGGCRWPSSAPAGGGPLGP